METQKEQLRKQLMGSIPPVFAGTSIDRLTGNAIRWKTIRNKRSKRLPEGKRVPDDCFLNQGARKVLIIRDPFLSWWMNQIN